MAKAVFNKIIYIYIYIYVGFWHDGYRKEKFMSQNLITMQAPGLAHCSGNSQSSSFGFCLLHQISVWAVLVARHISRRYSTSVHMFRRMLWVTVATASLFRASRH